ncbi:MAG: Cna B-type domain-containing protein [Oscillospiraceae bacterium]|nr:Cna B-type domain-containing protein [Oscillospiraceae bacterium]
MKRLISILLVISMLLCDFPVFAIGGEEEPAEEPVTVVETVEDGHADAAGESGTQDASPVTPADDEQDPASDGEQPGDGQEDESGMEELKLTVSNPTRAAFRNGTATFFVSASLTGDGAGEYAVSYTWQYCTTGDGLAAVAANPGAYAWKNTAAYPGGNVYANGGSLTLSGEAADFSGVYFRCIAEAAGLTAISGVGAVSTAPALKVGAPEEECEHEWSEQLWHPATCESDGFNADTCTKCGAIKEETKVMHVSDAPRHNFNLDWSSKAATCTDGFVTYHCNECGGTAVRPEAGAEGDGESHVYENGVCIVPGCGSVQEHTEHTWDKGTVTKPATCGEPGVRTYHCTYTGCTKTKTEPIPSTGAHNWVSGEPVLPTCTTEGYTPESCDVCGRTRRTEVVSALGHTYGEWETVEAADCTHDGAQTRLCTVCHAETSMETRVLAALGHDWDNGTVETAPTCTDEGTIRFSCRRDGCDESKTASLPVSDHTKGELISTTPATCAKDGENRYECSVCHEPIIEVIPRDENAHAWSDWSVVTPATCGQEGAEERHCTNSGCTASESRVIPVNSDAHSWGSWVTVTPATCTAAGLEKRVCTNEGCEAFEGREIPMSSHSYIDHVCEICGLSYPKTEEVRSRIEALPDPDMYPAQVTVKNAGAVLEEIAAIDEIFDSMTADERSPLTDPKYEQFEGLLDKLEKLRTICEDLLTVTVYTPKQGQQVFTLNWNDNASTDAALRTPAEDFLAASGATLRYTVTSADGSVTVGEGELPLNNASEALKEAFGFLYPASQVFPDSPLSCETYGATAYQIVTDEHLPVSYTATYTDYATMETVTEQFSIHYQISLKNPAPASYVYTRPDPAAGAVTVDAGGSAILTRLIDWEAVVSWMDDNNRSACGGETDAADSPRVSVEDFRNSTAVYAYKAGTSSSAADLVTREYGYTVSGTEDGNEWTVGLTGLPAYDNEGSILNYYISHKDGKLDAANGAGNYYDPKYENVGNYASKLDGLYNGGLMTEYLTNTVPFTVNKVWDDGNASDRPSAKLYIWRTTENYDDAGVLSVNTAGGYAVPDTADTVGVPTDAASGELIEISFGAEGALFPRYDALGRRYVYYGVEKNLSGSYQLTIDNNTAAAVQRNSAAVLDELSGSRYFLNGATLTNAPVEYATPAVTKNFVASSLQNFDPMSATFLLQKKEGDAWVNVVADDVIRTTGNAVVTDESITVTLTDFNAAKMDDSAAPVTLRYYDDDYNVISYRWIETGVSVNGGSASADPALWDENGEYQGELVLVEGNPQSGPTDTTVLFTAAQKGSKVTNTLIGTHQVQIKKYWYDEFGNSIADPAKLTDPAYDFIKTAAARFRINRDDGATTADGSLKDVNGEAVTDVFLRAENLFDVEEGDDYWTQALNLPRYDAEGNEYYYTVQELSIDGTKDIGWLKDQHYESEIFEEYGVWMKRTVSIHTNTMGVEGTILTFDVTKLWQDGSHVESRHPVNVRIYRVRDVLGREITPVAVSGTIALSDFNNWYQIQKIAGAPAQVDPATGETVKDSVKNYLVLEEGISVDNTNVSLHPGYGSMASYADALNAALDTDLYAGTVGTPSAVGSAWDGLDYIYRTTERINSAEKEYSDGAASYTLTNTRTALEDYELIKTWNAGSDVKGGGFGLYNGSTLLAEFTVRKLVAEDGTVSLVFDPDTDYAEHYDADPNSDYSSRKTPTFDYGKDPASGNYRAYLTFGDLPKFDLVGEENAIAIREIYMIDESGSRIDVTSGAAIVDGVQYSVSHGTTVEYAEQDYHRSGDQYTVSIVNSRSGSYSLVSNKVWRDDNSNVRPDVSFTVYRLTAKGDLLEYVNNGDTAAILSYVRSHAGSAESVMQDCYWNTQINTFYWTCSTDPVPQYNGEGYPYVYFAIENISGGDAPYEPYYCNLTVSDGYRPVNAAEPTEAEKEQGISWTQKVFAVQDELIPGAGNYFLLGDGVNGGAGGYASYYSATVVNRPEDIRTLNGTKIWKLPLGWTIPEDQFPTVEVELYRSTKQLLSGDYDDADAYVQAVIDAAEMVDIIRSAAPDKIIDTHTASYETHYNFIFPENDSYELDKYDRWGTVYHYYTIEKVEPGSGIQNFPSNKTVYEDNNFNITNVFSPEPPYVEVTVSKVWDISEDEKYAGQIMSLEDLTKNKLADAEITLYGAATSKSSGEWEKIGSNTAFGSVTLSADPSSADSSVTYDVKRAADGSITSVTASYTFRSYTDENGEHNLPFYWITDKPMWYSVTEKVVNGYEQGDANDKTVNGEVIFNEHVEFPNSREVSGIQVYSNVLSDATVKNVYIGELKEATFRKKWDDAYVDNDLYRPDTLALLIHRRSDASAEYDDAYNKGTYSTELNNYVLLNKADLQHLSVWSGKLTELLKYDPKGNEYTYYIYGEAANPGVSADGVLDLNAEGCTVVLRENSDKKIGEYYELTYEGDALYTNSFFEQVKVSLSAEKNWKINDNFLTSVSYDRFSLLRSMGILPKSVQYVVLRKTEGDTAWTTVPAVDLEDESYDSAHVTNYNGQQVLGRTVDLSAANATNYKELFNSRMNWKHLPKYKSLDVEYMYRVAEIVTWNDGTSSGLLPIDGTDSGNMSADISTTQNGNTGDWSSSLTNTLTSTRIRLAKRWDDMNGQDNTRPSYINLTIKRHGAENADAITVKLVANETDAASDAGTAFDSNTGLYYSTRWIEIPQVFNSAADIVFGQSAGNTYDISEEIVYESGRTQYSKTYKATIDSSKQGSIVDNGDNSYTLVVENTPGGWIPKDKVVELTASKKWSGDTNWEDTVRPNIRFQLQYLKQGTSNTWVSFTDETIKDFTKTENQTAIKDVQKTGTGSAAQYQATWTQMRKYWDEPVADGVAELIQYRVTELPADGYVLTENYKANTNSSKFNVSVNEPAAGKTDTATASLTNTLQTTQINVAKSWSTGGETLNAAEIAKLVELDALPRQLIFQLQWKVGSGDWTDLHYSNSTENVGAFIFNTVDLANAGATGKQISRKLPVYDKTGAPIEYRVLETALVYKNTTVTVDDGKAGDVSVTDAEGASVTKNDSKVFALENSYTGGKVIVEKFWNDSNNRDGVRPSLVTMRLYRDGVTASGFDSRITGTGAADNMDSATIEHMPVYKNGSATELAEYWFYEVLSSDYYITTYAADGTAKNVYYDAKVHADAENPGKVTVTNTERSLMQAEASKVWDDLSNLYGQRPTSVDLTLQYSTDNGRSWQDVTKVNAVPSEVYRNDILTPAADNGASVFTTSDVTQTLTGDAVSAAWGTAKWENLPTAVLVNGKSQKVSYRAYDSVNGYVFSTDSFSSDTVKKNAADTETAAVTNKAAAKANVTKTWKENNYSWLTRPDSVQVCLEARLKGSDGAYTEVPNSRKDLTGSAWSAEWDKLSDAYEYRVKELSVTYGSTVVSTVGSTESGTVGTYSYTASVSSSTSNDITTVTGSLTNTLVTGSLKIDKSWLAENNRDGVSSVTVKLKKDGVIMKDASGKDLTWQITANGGWTLTIADLPMYRNDAAGQTEENKCVYEVLEVESAGVTAVIGDPITLGEDPAGNNVTVINNYTPERGSLSVSKRWNDADNAYASRSEKLYFKLQYKQNGAWTDVPTGTIGEDGLYVVNGTVLSGSEAATTSVPNVEGTAWHEISAADGTYTWENLPVHILDANGASVSAEYRVLEGIKSGSTVTEIAAGGSLNGYTVSYASASLKVQDNKNTATTVTNTLKLKPLEVSKTWVEPEGMSELVRPDSATFKVEYRLGSSGTWATLPANVTVKNISNSMITLSGSGTEWTLTTGGLPATAADGTPYEYRVSEAWLTYGSDRAMASEDGSRVGAYKAEVTAVSSGEDAYTVSATNTMETGSLNLEKIWDDENNRDNGEKNVELSVYRILTVGSTTKEQLVSTVTLSAESDWKAALENLPVYDNITGEKSVYLIRETGENRGEWMGDNNVRYTVSYSENVTLAESGSKTSELKVTNKHIPDAGKVTVSKVWKDEENRYDSRPESITFELQWNNNGVWTTVTPNTEHSDTGVYTKSANPQTLTGTLSTAFEGVPVRLNGNKISYRIVETYTGSDGEATGYTTTYSVSVTSLDKADDEKAVTVTNTLKLKPLKVSKTWVEPEGMSELVRPDSATFKVEYRLGSSGTWATLPANVTVKNISNSMITLSGSGTEWTLTTGGLPATAADGTPYEYRVSEAWLTYGSDRAMASEDGSRVGAYKAEVTAVSSGEDAYTVSATNTMETGSLNLEKIWDDENNRDNGEKNVELSVYRILTVGSTTKEQLVSTVTLSAESDWKAALENLPVYDNITGEKSVYLIRETGENRGEWMGDNNVRYTVSYSENVTLAESGSKTSELKVTNKHIPDAGKVTVSKVWKDEENRYDSRPESITFELQWNNNGVWTTVTPNTEHSDTGVYTKSANPQTLTGTLSTAFEGVPVRLNGNKISYRIVETYTGSDGEATGYTTTYSVSAVTVDSAADEKTVTVTNELVTGKLALSKSWSEDKYLEPVSAEFSVWYKLGAEGSWIALPGADNKPVTVTLNSANGWKWELSGVPETDAQGTEYFYSFRETAVEYKVCGKTVKVDAAEESFDVNSWKGMAGCYTAEIVGEKSGSGAESVFSFKAENTAETGSLKLRKSWRDAENRDDDRETVTFRLLRDGVNYGDTVTVREGDDKTLSDWMAEYNDLPIYKDDSSGEKSVYTVKELNESDGTYTGTNGRSFTVEYSSGIQVTETEPGENETLTVTNTREFDVFDVTVGKSWIDNSNYYGLRSTSVELKLQYSADGKASWQDVTLKLSEVPTPDEDDGTGVFTTSNPVQTLSGSSSSNDWGTLRWENLPANAKVNGVSTKLYYRVVETDESIAETGYTSTPSTAVSFEDARLTGGRLTADSGKVVNELTDTYTLRVTKTWDGGGTYDAWPDKVLVTLQVSTDGGESWSDVQNCINVELTAANRWSYTFSELRKNPDYTYRAIETAIVYLENADKGTPAETFTMAYTAEDKSAGRAGSYDMTTELSFDEESGLFSAEITNVYNPIPVEVVLSVSKLITGDKRLVDSEIRRFTFLLTDAAGNSIKTSVVDTGTAEFAKLTFNRPGTYTYTVTEVNDRAERYIYDGTKHTIVITVTDTNGILSLSWTGDGENEQIPEFTNNYKVPGDLKAPTGIPLHEGYCFD